MFTCKYCGREFKTSQGVKRHAGYCKINGAFDKATEEVPNLEPRRTYPYHSHDRTWWLCPVCGEHLYTIDGDHITATWCCHGCLSIVNRQGEILSRYQGSALDRRAV